MKQITDKVSWVGVEDWDLATFHGRELSTYRGSSYNSYLVKDQKTALIDTVRQPFAAEFLTQLRQGIDLSAIDYVICNHSEPDHSGALPALMREIPGKPIYCTAFGAKALQGQYHQDWNYVTVKTGDRLDLGQNQLMFIEAPMLHWPDSMFTYLTGEGILFSNDAFGQHYATEGLYNNLADQIELYGEAIKYYANILTPFSSFVTKKINEILSFNLPLNMICPSHGVIWKDNPGQIVELYLNWANNYQENQITLVYDTMWNATLMMAEAIAEGISMADPSVMVRLMNSSIRDKSDIMTEIFRSKAILLGSPTINNGYLYSIAGILEMAKGLKFKNKKAAAFGSYGWSGEAVAQLTQGLKDSGFQVVNDGLRMLWVPDEAGVAACREFGARFVQAL